MDVNNVKPAIRCPKCRAKGTVVNHKDNILVLECKPCNQRWHTYSKTCRDCGAPNYFYVDGPCVKCYSQWYCSHG